MRSFKDRRSGTVRVELTRLEGGRIRLVVMDNGVGLPDSFNMATSQSLGLRLISTLARQLRAELKVRGSEGSSFALTFLVA